MYRIRFRLSANLLAEKCVLKGVGFKNQLFKNGPIDDVIMTSYHQSNNFFRYFNTHPKRLSSQRVVTRSSNLFRSPDIPCNRWVNICPLYIYPYIHISQKSQKQGFWDLQYSEVLRDRYLKFFILPRKVEISL